MTAMQTTTAAADAAVRPPPPASTAAAATEEDVFLTLTDAGQACAVPVLAVRDVLGAHAITRIPLAPGEVAGSLNLRGRIVTALDLRLRLGLPPIGSSTIFAPIFAAYRRRYPGIEVRLVEHGSDRLEEVLRAGIAELDRIAKHVPVGGEMRAHIGLAQYMFPFQRLPRSGFISDSA